MSTIRKVAFGLFTTVGFVIGLVGLYWDAAANNAAWVFYAAAGLILIGLLILGFTYLIRAITAIRSWIHHIRQYDAVEAARSTAETERDDERNRAAILETERDTARSRAATNATERDDERNRAAILETERDTARSLAATNVTERDDALSRIAILDAERIAAEARIETLERIAGTVAAWQARAEAEFSRGYARAVGEVLAAESSGTFNTPTVVLHDGRFLVTAVPRDGGDLAPLGSLFRVVHTPSETTAMWLRCEKSTASGRASIFVPDRYGALTEGHLRAYAEPGASWPVDYAIVAPNIDDILKKE